jgi:hypothetical protein
VKRQGVTGLAARARLAEDGAAHHLPLAVYVEADCLLLLQFLSRRLRLQSLRRAAVTAVSLTSTASPRGDKLSAGDAEVCRVPD